MASSSVSQDDVDNNYEKNSRRSRIRTARARQINPSGASKFESQAIGDTDDGTICLEEAAHHISVSAPGESTFGNVEHETSPKPVLRTATAAKDAKRPTKPPHHVNKGKQQRDRRKLREKRRSTGVVHLASTESTGGSTTGDDEESSDAAGAFNASNITASVGGITLTAETRKNTLQNESISALDIAKEHLLMTSNFRMQNSSSDVSNGSGAALYHHHHHHHTSRCAPGNCSGSHRRNKSPSDLEADDENDHDSLNQSEESCSHMSSTACSKMTKSGGCAGAQFNVDDEVERVVEENRRLLSIVEEKDRRIHMLEIKVQQLMRDTLTISEEQARLQKENTTLLRALSKLTSERNASLRKAPQATGEDL